MAQMNSQATLVGNFKEVYGPKLQYLYEFLAPLCSQYAKFAEQGASPGNLFHNPVDLTMEQGLTSAAASTSSAAQIPGITSGVTYIPPITGVTGDAQAAGAQIFGRAQVSYEAIFRSSSDKKAFENATRLVVKRLMMSHLKRQEIQMIHGQRGLGEVSANPANGASRVIVLTQGSWSSGLWAGMVGARLEFWNAALSARVTDAGDGTATAIVTAISPGTRSITVAFSDTDDQTRDLTTCPNIFFETASPSSEMAGLDKWARVTSGSTFFNVSTDYELWQGNSLDLSSQPLRFANLMDVSAEISSYGLLSGRLCAVVNPKTFASLNADQAALRRYDVKYSSSELRNGTEKLVFNTAGVELEVLSHPFEKEGLCHIFAPDEAFRIGSTDITFITRHGDEEKLILESATSPGSEMRTYSMQQLFLDTPKHSAVIYGIVN